MMKGILVVVLCSLAATTDARIVVHAPPANESLSTQYHVRVNDEDVPVYLAPCNKVELGATYSFASFAADGVSKIEIVSQHPLEHLQVRPKSAQVHPEVSGSKLSFSIDRPQKLSIEPQGKTYPLLLLIDPLPKDEPRNDDPKVRYFGSGIHKPKGGKIELHDGETLYLAAGAIVHAGVTATGAKHIRIAGPGILDGGDWQWAKGPTPQMLHFEKCEDVRIEGITIRASFIWTIATWNASDVLIDNVKILGDRLPNDDGIDLCNTQHVKIHDCFIRTDDDCIALKGMNDKRNGATSDIEISNCFFWGDRARIVLMGHESQATEMSNIRVHDCQILHYTQWPFLLEPGEDMPLKNVRIENIHINADGRAAIARLRPTVNEYMKEKVPGRIDDVAFRNITVENASGVGIDVSGADEQHETKDVSFDNVRVDGKIVTRDQIKVGSFTNNVSVGP